MDKNVYLGNQIYVAKSQNMSSYDAQTITTIKYMIRGHIFYLKRILNSNYNAKNTFGCPGYDNRGGTTGKFQSHAVGVVSSVLNSIYF